jgi:uncharacterized protein (DUF1778 family)
LKRKGSAKQTKPLALRASEEERTTWEKAAQDAGLRLSAWIREACNAHAELEQAMEAQLVDMQRTAVLKDPPTVSQVKDMMYPQTRKRCVHRQIPGTFCKKCGVTK